jgi:ABC-type bacteriocin/lantibiotic exporter with double-glycine peptidase domain
LNHFVVLSKIDKLKAHVLDLAKGSFNLSIDKFEKHFTELLPHSLGSQKIGCQCRKRPVLLA